MIIFIFIAVGLYVWLIIVLAKKASAKSIENNVREIQLVEQEFQALQIKEKQLRKEKSELESEASKIFTLYEMTKEIAESLSEKRAFEIFEHKLKKHVNFTECRFLDPQSKEVRSLRKKNEYSIFTLRGKNKVGGYIAVKDVTNENKEKVTILGHQFALALRRVKLHQEIETVAITDSLTELHTRRYTLKRLNEEVNRSSLLKKHMSFLMIDVDYFKSFNDKYGHLTGDQILREIGTIIKENVREIDIAGRFGGEEFCVVLPDTDLTGAQFAAERIREAVEKRPIQAYDNTVTTTLSIGIATYPQDGKSAEAIIDRADWSLYKAKKQGRNRVCFFGE